MDEAMRASREGAERVAGAEMREGCCKTQVQKVHYIFFVVKVSARLDFAMCGLETL